MRAKFGAVWRRIRAKSVRQLARFVALRFWPLSLVGRRYYRRHFGPRRYEAANGRAAELYAAHARPLSPQHAEVLSELRDEGVSMAPIGEIIPGVSVEQLAARAQSLLTAPRLRAKIDGRANRDDAKWYVVRALGFGRDIPLPDWMAGVVLHPQLLALAAGYLGFYPRLTYVDVWHNFVVTSGEPGIDSELWHRDHEDVRLFRLFLYLSDIDEGGGPHEYLRRTHSLGERYRVWPHTPPRGDYPPANWCENAGLGALRRVCTGAAGAAVLADTAGLHRGGRCLSSARTLLTATYTSNLALDANTYRLADEDQYAALDEAGRYALCREAAPFVEPAPRLEILDEALGDPLGGPAVPQLGDGEVFRG